MGLIALTYWKLSGEIVELKKVKDDHEKRIQKQEDVTALKMDTLIGKVDKLEVSNEELKIQVSELAHNLHKEKNAEHQLTSVMNLVLKELQKRNE